MGYSGASHFASSSAWEVQRTHHFEIMLPGLAKGEQIRLAVASVKLPDIQIQTADLKHGNETVKVAQNPQYQGGQIIVNDAIGVDIEMILWAWFRTVFDINDYSVMGLVVDYKKTARLIQWSPNNTVGRTWLCTGVFPTQISPGQYSYDQPAKKTITLSLAVDKVFAEREGSTELFAAAGGALSQARSAMGF